MLTQPKIARIIFDEAHSEAWTIRRERAEEMQPAHPEDSSYARAAERLAERDFEVLPNADRPLTRETLAGADVLVIAHPSDPKWEATVNSRPPRFSDAELDAIEEFVLGGGGLIALGETEQEKYGNNLNDLLARFGSRSRTEPCRTTSTTTRPPPGCWLSSNTPPTAPRPTAPPTSICWPASTAPASTAPAR